jgi:purine-cytosine permease-like protein
MSEAAVDAGAGPDLAPPGTEYEREPVPPAAQMGLSRFVGMYAGEHVAGTELMIGPLFLAAGVSARDLIAGLLVGNLLAVLSWVLFTGPIAARARLTLYYQLERICGRNLVVLYNLANGVMFCFLAGAMITVSATAVGVWFDFPMPGLNDVYPNSVGWVVAVLVVGVLIAVVAALGYETVAKFANVAAPWMVLVFVAFGLIALAEFIRSSGTPVRTAGDLWNLASTQIWRGGAPFPGRTKFTFWHVAFFAWFCNMAMHIGMSDLSVLRFARKGWFAAASAAGMFVGHFMAWIAASLLYALQLYDVNLAPGEIEALRKAGLLEAFRSHERVLTSETIGELINAGVWSGPPAVLPGPMAYGVASVAGVLCVILAGWTTANPTIYRAGLAFQAIIPGSSRRVVTFLTGLLATAAGLFPAIAMQLLDFVAIYGLILMPMGAVIFVDFWLARRLGFASEYAARTGSRFNVAAAVAWLATIAACLGAVRVLGNSALFFISLPGWFLAAGLYVALSRLLHRRVPPGPV